MELKMSIELPQHKSFEFRYQSRNKDIYAIGRAGTTACIGLQLDANKRHNRIAIVPINKKGYGNGEIDIDPEDVGALIETLTKCKEYLESVENN
jgi:hypothetical protein